jgi:citrate synthase
VKIGKETIPHTAICTSDEDTIVVRGEDLCRDLIGRISFSDYFYLLLTGRRPAPAASRVLEATLVAIAEHGLVPSVQAARMTLAAAPDAVQGAVAAGLLGCGSVILGASETAGRLFADVRERQRGGQSEVSAVREVLAAWHATGKPIPGYGHPLHKRRDPRVEALIRIAHEAQADLTYVRIAEQIEEVVPSVVGKALRMNVSAAIPAVLLGIGFPLSALKGVPLLARTAGLIAHLSEEQESPSGFALSYQATREVRYDGTLPEGVKLR